MKKKTTVAKPTTNPNQKVLNLFSANLKKAVEATGLSAYALARKFGLDQHAISCMVYKGRDPRLSSVSRIAKAMKISLDDLVGNVPEKRPVQATPTPEVETKKENLSLIKKISKMPDQDVELLEVIADVLDKRRVRAVAKLLNAVKGAKPTLKSEKEGLMAKAAKLQNSNAKGSLSDNGGEDELDDDEFEDDFEDEDFDEDDDFDEDEEDFGDDDDDLYEDDDDFDED